MAYTTSTNKLNIVDLDFDSIKAALVAYLRGQETFQDYNFEGSAMNILLDVLAYNTHYNGFYTNMLASEMFIDSATLRSSVVSLAKHLGYVPSSKVGSVVLLDISIEDPNSVITSNYVQLSPGTKFVSRKEDTNKVYTFLVEEKVLAYKNSSTGKYEAKSVKVREGAGFSKTYVAEGTENEKFVIPNDFVDLPTVEVYKNSQKFNRIADITKVTDKSKVVWVQEGTDGRYEVFFGSGVLGESAQLDDVVLITYRVSILGEDGNGFKVFVISDVLEGQTSLVVSASLSSSNPNGSYGGSNKETIGSIKKKAPSQYAHQNRYVTTEDYRSAIINGYAEIENVRVWGGDENIPSEPGRVYISAKLKNGLGLSRVQKVNLIREIQKRNPASITPVVVDPEFVEILLQCSVTFDPNDTSMKPNDIIELVKGAIKEYSTEINDFDNYFRYSVFLDRVSQQDNSILNSTATLKLRKTFRFNDSITDGPVIEFKNRLKVQPGSSGLKTYPPFDYTVGMVSYVNCEIRESNGILQFFGTPRNNQSSPPVHLNNIGYINYETGVLDVRGCMGDVVKFHKIKNPGVFGNYGQKYLTFTVTPAEDNIVASRNTLLHLNDDDSTVTIIDDTDILRFKKFGT